MKTNKTKRTLLDQDFVKKPKKPKFDLKHDPLRKNKKAYLINPDLSRDQ